MSETPYHAKKARPESCELCGRAQPLTFHHLIPRKNHRRKGFRKRYAKLELVNRGAWLCRPCHGMLHRTYSEGELGRELNTLADLRAQPEVQRFVAWVSRQR